MTFGKEGKEGNKNFRKFESFQVGFLGNNKPEIGRAIITIANILNIVIQIFFTKMFFVVRHLDVVLEDPLVVREKSLFYKTVDNQECEMPTKFHDDRTINSWVIEERRFRHNIPCAPSPWCCSWGSSDRRNEFSCI